MIYQTGYGIIASFISTSAMSAIAVGVIFGVGVFGTIISGSKSNPKQEFKSINELPEDGADSGSRDGIPPSCAIDDADCRNDQHKIT